MAGAEGDGEPKEMKHWEKIITRDKGIVYNPFISRIIIHFIFHIFYPFPFTIARC